MHDQLIEELPIPQRLALAYGTRLTRSFAVPMLVLDQRLAQAIRQQNEPVLAQMRLAWWRDLLAKPHAQRTSGDPLISKLETWLGEEKGLIAMIDGWERLIAGNPLTHDCIRAFVKGRSEAFVGLARLVGALEYQAKARKAGELWALADLIANMSDPVEKEMAFSIAPEAGEGPDALPRSLRPLTVLAGLGDRSLANGGRALLNGPVAGLAAVRLGLFGR